MADVLQVPASTITPETCQDDLTNWDSIQHLNLLLALEEEFRLKLEVEDLQSLTSVRSILNYVDSKWLSK